MSVVAAKIYPDGFDMAADSIKVRSYTQTIGNSKHAKIWERGPLVIGGVGTCAENGLMRLFSENHQPESEDERGILSYMGEFAAWKKKTVDSFVVENHYLIGMNKRIFHLEGFGLEEITTYEAIGAGMDFALAAMKCGAGVEQAIEVAIDLSIYCAAPIHVIRRRG